MEAHPPGFGDFDWRTVPARAPTDAVGPTTPVRSLNTSGTPSAGVVHANSFQSLAEDSEEDESYDESSEESGEGPGSDSESDETISVSELSITNSELAEILPSKTQPVAASTKQSKKRPKSTRAAAVAANETIQPSRTHKRKRKNDGSGSHGASKKRARDTLQHAGPESNIEANGTTQMAGAQQATGTAELVDEGLTKKQGNIIYAFYERVDNNAHGQVGEKGDQHYRCWHADNKGNRKVLTITKRMKGSTTGLVGHLKHFPEAFRLYEILRKRDMPPSVLELQLACGQGVLTPEEAQTYIADLEKKAEELVQCVRASLNEPWDQDRFERLLAEWIAVCDQPFDAVEKPELRTLLQYTYHRPERLDIPSATTIKKQIMELSDKYVEELTATIKAMTCKVSLSLDAWTSSNGFAFLAIVMHYVTDDWRLEEILIGFEELIGQHSGKNMAEVLWRTMEVYGLIGRIIAINCDNATSNDTLLAEIELLCHEHSIQFSAKQARMRCVPHTIHLSALELLSALGVISKADQNAASSGSRSNYQESVTAPVDRVHDDELVGQDDPPEEALDGSTMTEHPLGSTELPAASSATYGHLHQAIHKLRKIIRAVRASPQRRQAWLEEVRRHPELVKANTSETALMLILDVPTRWSSTHQMLRRACTHQGPIDKFVCDPANKDLRQYELSWQEWEGLSIVTQWLRLYRDATLEMSVTARPTVLEVSAVFKGLQEHLRTLLSTLPRGTPPMLRDGLINAHFKLSDYSFLFEGSPFYAWASLLDPRISRKNLEVDCGDDDDALCDLHRRISDLREYYNENYCPTTTFPPSAEPLLASLGRSATASGPSTPRRPPHSSSRRLLVSPDNKTDFTARYQTREPASTAQDELDEYFALKPQPFKSCDPLQWWSAHQAQFPTLSKLARDLLSIPGCAVAVERVFSGGRDTISLRRGSLRPETIKKLMLIKHHLRRAREAVQHVLDSKM